MATAKIDKQYVEALELELARTKAELADTVIKLKQHIGRSNRLAKQVAYGAEKPGESPSFREACMEYQKAHPGKAYTFAEVRNWLAAGKPAPVAG